MMNYLKILKSKQSNQSKQNKLIITKIEEHKKNYINHKEDLNKYFSRNIEKIYYLEKPYKKDKESQNEFENKFISYSFLIALINLEIFTFRIFCKRMEAIINKIKSNDLYNLLDRIKIFFSYSLIYLHFKGETDLELCELTDYCNDSFLKGERFFRNIIKNMDEYSHLFFIYIQLNSGIGVNLYDHKTYYRISMIDLYSIKNHILSLCPKYFFTFMNKKSEDIAFTCPFTLVESFNETKIFNNLIGTDNDESDSLTNYSLVQFHESGHGKFSSSTNGENSPRYFLDSSFNPVEQKTWEEDKDNLRLKGFQVNTKNNEILCFKGESGKCVDYYLYNKMPLVIFGLLNCKKEGILQNINLFIGPSLESLHKKIEEISSLQNLTEEEEKKEKGDSNISKLEKKKKRERNKYEDIGHILLKLSKEERTKIYNRLYPKVEEKDNEEDEDDKFYPLDDSKKVPMRSDYGIFIISN